MNLFPINLDIRGKSVVIVGGGAVAQRKCRSLLDAEAVITIIAPEASETLTGLAEQERLTLRQRSFQSGDLAGAVLVFAATDDRSVNSTVADEAKNCGIPVCMADEPTEGTFTSPSVVRRGDLLITISTGGKSPALARKIRQELELRYGPEYAALVTELGDLREKLLTEGRQSDYYKQIFNELLDRALPRLRQTTGVGERDRPEADTKEDS